MGPLDHNHPHGNRYIPRPAPPYPNAMGGEGAVSLQYSPKAQTARTIHKAQTKKYP